METTPQVQTGWLDNLKETLKLEKIKEFLTGSRIVEMALYIGIGFLIGFIVRRFGRLIAIAIAVFVILGILQHLEILTFGFNWNKINQLLGIPPLPTVDEALLAYYLAWFKENIMAVFMMILGFLLGLRIG